MQVIVDEYRQTIERFAAERINQNISNGLPQHAKILLETMFKNASAEMRIYTGDLNADIYGDVTVVDAIKTFLLKPYAKLVILLQNQQPTDWAEKHPLIKALSLIRGSHGSVEIRFASGNYSTDEANHFAVMDNDAFRYEHNHENCEAVANFNNSKTAKQLVSVFDQVRNISISKMHQSAFQLEMHR